MASGPSTAHPSSVHQAISSQGEPAWDIAMLYPMQGTWSEEEYLSLTDSTNWLIEYTVGRVEVLPMPTIEHRLIVKFLLRALDNFVEPKNFGMVLFAPTRVYVKPDKYREPDILVLSHREHRGKLPIKEKSLWPLW